jgi:dGTPase
VLRVFENYLADSKTTAILLKEKTGRPNEEDFIEFLTRRHASLSRLAKVGYLRTKFTSALVGEFTNGVEFKIDRRCPALSNAYLSKTARMKVEVLKTFAYESLIQSPRLKVAEYRGKEIVTTLFQELSKKDGHELLPDDFRNWYDSFARDKGRRKRVVCDFIAGMTDEYAVEFYARLKSEDPATIFKPF